MTVLERTRKKLLHAISHDMNEKRLLQIIKLYDESPLSYSVEELRESIDDFEDRYFSGNFVGIPHDEVMKEYGL